MVLGSATASTETARADARPSFIALGPSGIKALISELVRRAPLAATDANDSRSDLAAWAFVLHMWAASGLIGLSEATSPHSNHKYWRSWARFMSHATALGSDELDDYGRKTLTQAVNVALIHLRRAYDFGIIECAAADVLARQCPIRAWTSSELEELCKPGNIDNMVVQDIQAHLLQQDVMLSDIDEQSADRDDEAPDDGSALQAAARSIMRRDEKMRWVFGG
ncbi:hypothetical protein OIV83_006443 [Microbotryomycetes sp. JL201]|nr:hypothetical protein OIV83_006443 [Microbotryomycetes sp. JL201]